MDDRIHIRPKSGSNKFLKFNNIDWLNLDIMKYSEGFLLMYFLSWGNILDTIM